MINQIRKNGQAILFITNCTLTCTSCNWNVHPVFNIEPHTSCFIGSQEGTPTKEDPTGNDIGDAADLQEGEVAPPEADPDETSL